jgi:hypothetical protein
MVNDKERRQWVDHDEGLYDLHRRSKVPVKKWVRENRALIDTVIKAVMSGVERTGYLKYR